MNSEMVDMVLDDKRKDYNVLWDDTGAMVEGYEALISIYNSVMMLLDGNNYYQLDVTVKGIVHLYITEFYLLTGDIYFRQDIDALATYKNDLAKVVDTYKEELEAEYEKKVIELKREFEHKIKEDIKDTSLPNYEIIQLKKTIEEKDKVIDELRQQLKNANVVDELKETKKKLKGCKNLIKQKDKSREKLLKEKEDLINELKQKVHKYEQERNMVLHIKEVINKIVTDPQALSVVVNGERELLSLLRSYVSLNGLSDKVINMVENEINSNNISLSPKTIIKLDTSINTELAKEIKKYNVKEIIVYNKVNDKNLVKHFLVSDKLSYIKVHGNILPSSRILNNKKMIESEFYIDYNKYFRNFDTMYATPFIINITDIEEGIAVCNFTNAIELNNLFRNLFPEIKYNSPDYNIFVEEFINNIYLVKTLVKTSNFSPEAALKKYFNDLYLRYRKSVFINVADIVWVDKLYEYYSNMITNTRFWKISYYNVVEYGVTDVNQYVVGTKREFLENDKNTTIEFNINFASGLNLILYTPSDKRYYVPFLNTYLEPITLLSTDRTTKLLVGYDSNIIFDIPEEDFKAYGIVDDVSELNKEYKKSLVDTIKEVVGSTLELSKLDKKVKLINQDQELTEVKHQADLLIAEKGITQAKISKEVAETNLSTSKIDKETSTIKAMTANRQALEEYQRLLQESVIKDLGYHKMKRELKHELSKLNLDKKILELKNKLTDKEFYNKLKQIDRLEDLEDAKFRNKLADIEMREYKRFSDTLSSSSKILSSIVDLVDIFI
jgi:hypothetical protein